jgi:hypothetical protein
VAAQILWLNSLAGPAVLAFNFLAYASLTLLLWIATRGRHPFAVPAGVILLGACALNPFVAAAAALLTAGPLFFLQGKPVCAESSPR